MKDSVFHVACTIVDRLQGGGHSAAFVGGAVRDLLLQVPCTDIDIVTSATPEEVLILYPKAIKVGISFGVVRVIQQGHEFEIATFRTDGSYVDGRHPLSVSLNASMEEDAKRRDFTINGMMYDPSTGTIFDYVGGKKDLEEKVIRTIGVANERFSEDRLRLLRAIRFKNLLSFSIEKETWNALCANSQYILESVSKERIWQELLKMKRKNILAPCLKDMLESGLLQYIFPVLQNISINVLENRIHMISRYTGEKLVAAICLLFQDESIHFLKSFGRLFRLSGEEMEIISLFICYGFSFDSLEEFQLVKIFAHKDSSSYIHAIASLNKEPKEFLLRYDDLAQQLIFWTDQIRRHQFFVSANDLLPYKIGPSQAMGMLLHKAFLLSLKKRIKDKEKILKMIFDVP